MCHCQHFGKLRILGDGHQSVRRDLGTIFEASNMRDVRADHIDIYRFDHDTYPQLGYFQIVKDDENAMDFGDTPFQKEPYGKITICSWYKQDAAPQKLVYNPI